MEDKDIKSYVQVNFDKLYFYQIDNNKNKLISLEGNFYKSSEDITFFIKKYRHKEKLQIIDTSQFSSLVPLKYFDKSFLSKYLNTNYIIQPNDNLYFDNLSDNIINVYAQTRGVEVSDNIELSHYVSKMYELVLSKIKDKRRYVIIDYQKDFFRMMIVYEQKLTFYNIFFYENIDEFIYHILFTLEQLDIEALQTSIYELRSLDNGYIPSTNLLKMERYVKGFRLFEITTNLNVDSALKQKINTNNIQILK